MKSETIAFTLALLILVPAHENAMEVPEYHRQYAAGVFEGFLNNNVRPEFPDSVAKLGDPYVVAIFNTCDLKKLKDDLDILDVPHKITYCWPVLLNHSVVERICVSEDKSSHGTTQPTDFTETVQSIRDQNPEYRGWDFYVFASERSYLFIVLTKSSEELFATAPSAAQIFSLSTLDTGMIEIVPIERARKSLLEYCESFCE